MDVEKEFDFLNLEAMEEEAQDYLRLTIEDAFEEEDRIFT